jgi:hypothetical protein
MVLFDCFIYRPWVDERHSGNLVAIKDHHGANSKREFLINPHFITDLVSHTLGSTFKYSENFGDRREKWSQVICNKTPAQIITFMNTTPHSNAITLPIFPSNNPSKTAVNTTIQWATISIVDRYNPNPDDHCWVTYTKGSFKRVQVLVHLALEDVLDLVRTGNTSSTFSSIPDILSYIKFK